MHGIRNNVTSDTIDTMEEFNFYVAFTLKKIPK